MGVVHPQLLGATCRRARRLEDRKSVYIELSMMHSRLAASPAPLTHHEHEEELAAWVTGPAESRLERGRAHLAKAREQIGAWHRGGMAGLSVARLLSRASDELVRGLWSEVWTEHTAPPNLMLLALGGYGRRELSPHSDLDLLLLCPTQMRPAELKPLANAFSTTLWDLKLTVGWSVRTGPECLSAAREDLSAATALLDARLLVGSEPAFSQLRERLLEDLHSRADDFVRRKAEELRSRRHRYGDSVFMLEPQLKQGEGGLRDLETARWITQARQGLAELKGLAEAGVLPEREVQALRAARDFLLRVRHEMHFIRGRKEDRLTFDLQEAVARFLDYRDSSEGLPVEQFMRDYYLSAQTIRRATDAVIARAEEHHGPRPPGPADRPLGPFRLHRGRLTVVDETLFQRDPGQVVPLFQVAEREGVRIGSHARDLVTHALPGLEQVKGAPEVTSALKALLLDSGTRGETLWRMHELGALGAVLPEFGRITARHQHDLYHAYTVDVHSLFALRELYSLRAGERMAEAPELSRLMRDLKDPLPLYLGMLFHDAGKGLGGSHSERGRELMSKVGERLGLGARQREVAEFLVLHHLLMSHTAQRRDLSDPHLVEDFARTVGDVERLTALYLLTYADIRSVGPKMWTDWKARLVHELFVKARSVLTASPGAAGHEEEAREARFHEAWTLAFGPERAQRLARTFSKRYFWNNELADATLHARLIQRAWSGRHPGLVCLVRPREGFSELLLCTSDRHGLLSLVTGVLAGHGIDVLRARIESTQDGWAMDAFDVRVAHGPRLGRQRWRRARWDLIRVLSGEMTVDGLIARRAQGTSLPRPAPKVSTKVSTDNTASRRYTVVDVRAEDRIGLLYAITQTLADEDTDIALAKVATEANRAVDSFYITRKGAKLEDPSELAKLIRAVERAVDPAGPTSS
jgi:[protein-PII] uridylyltransferase